MAEIIVDYMLALKCVSRNKYVAHRKNLYTVGSILGTGMCNATVWGSGYIDKYTVGNTYKKILPKLRKLDIRAVRGPLTRDVLLSTGYDCPEVYGDPAVLLPLIYTPNVSSDMLKTDYKLVKHFTDNTECKDTIPILTKDYKNFVNQIVTSKKLLVVHYMESLLLRVMVFHLFCICQNVLRKKTLSIEIIITVQEEWSFL